MSYIKKVTLSQNIWNNAFSYTERQERFGIAELTIPSLKQIDTIADIQLWNHIVFEEVDNQWSIRSCTWLVHIYQLKAPPFVEGGLGGIYIFDNHNHALYFRLQHTLTTTHQWPITVYHIDQHSDLNRPDEQIDPEQLHDENYRRAYTNLICNVGNFIPPFLDLYPNTQFERIKSESQLLNSKVWDLKSKVCIVDIDLEFRAPEMSIKQYEQTIEKTKELIDQASLITIATSPYFLDQPLALHILNDIFDH